MDENEIIDELRDGMKNLMLATYEANEERHAQREKRQSIFHLIVELVLIVLLVGSNVAWLLYENSMETVEETTTETSTVYEDVVQESESGDNSIVGGDYVNGKAND